MLPIRSQSRIPSLSFLNLIDKMSTPHSHRTRSFFPSPSFSTFLARGFDGNAERVSLASMPLHGGLVLLLERSFLAHRLPQIAKIFRVSVHTSSSSSSTQERKRSKEKKITSGNVLQVETLFPLVESPKTCGRERVRTAWT